MMSASNIPIPESDIENATRVLLLPAFVFVDNVTPANVPALINDVINPAPVNMAKPSSAASSLTVASPMLVRQCPYDYLVLLCSHKTRDARCGQSAPIIKKELERHLRPLGLLRDLHDDRPGGVGIYFVSHVGGHKFAANMLVYRRAGTPGAEYVPDEEHANDAAAKMAVHEAAVSETIVEALQYATLVENGTSHTNGSAQTNGHAKENGAAVNGTSQSNGTHEVAEAKIDVAVEPTTAANGHAKENGAAVNGTSQSNGTHETAEAKIDVTVEPTPAANGATVNGGSSQENGHKAEPLDELLDERRPEAGQCIWLARVRPEHCENIVNFTILQGKVVKPGQQLRGGFDRCKQLSSW
jgi:hypothetical protein